LEADRADEVGFSATAGVQRPPQQLPTTNLPGGEAKPFRGQGGEPIQGVARPEDDAGDGNSHRSSNARVRLGSRPE
jgi:hypothetical protein